MTIDFVIDVIVVEAVMPAHRQRAVRAREANVDLAQVEMMNGNIWVTGEVGVGSTFHVKLNGVAIAQETDLIQPASDGNEKAVVFDPATVLVVDDAPMNRRLIKNYLSDYDLILMEAEGGAEAVEMAKTHRPDIVLMDYRMPELDGLEALERMRREPALQDIPVVFVTASAMNEQVELLKKAGDGVLTQPVSKAEVVTELVRFYGTRFNRDSLSLSKSREGNGAE